MIAFCFHNEEVKVLQKNSELQSTDKLRLVMNLLFIEHLRDAMLHTNQRLTFAVCGVD